MKKPRTAQPTMPVATASRQVEEKRYNRQSWRNERYGLRAALLARNPVCQRIIDDEQCHNASRIIHHLTSPLDRPELFYETKNLVCVCVDHHPGGERGTPEWAEGRDFVSTRFEFSFSV